VRPGDTLRLEVQLEALRRGIGKGRVTATVDGAIVTRGEILFAVGDAPQT
jgi:3-hydroxyacyl-[acyl-carrier-protein] dehydratase